MRIFPSTTVVARNAAALAVLAAAALPSATVARAQTTYPTKPVRVITFSAGSLGDTLARHVGQRLAERWGQPVVVDNRAGAGGTLAAALAAKAPPDGYTLLMGGLPSHAGSVSLYKNLPYDPVKDFAPITLGAETPLVLVAHPSVPAASLREFIEHARRHPGAINYSSGGNGSASHLTAALFTHAAGIKLVHVPYKGIAPAMSAVLAREVDVMCNGMAIVAPLIGAGRVKAYAVASKQRFPTAPEVLTAAEAGLPGFESTTWFGMFAPANTPPAIVGRLNQDIVEILRSPATRTALLAQGAQPVPGTPAEFEAFIRSEVARWKEVIRVSGAKVD